MQHLSRATGVLSLATAFAVVISAATSFAQLPPEIGYLLPVGGQPGTTVDVILGGYDWTPDTQVFVHDPRVKLEITGAPTEVLITEPPYWFGYKARGYAWPLPREFPAKLTIPADVAPGLIRWQAANANGVSAVGQIHICSSPAIPEDPGRKSAQVLPALPVTVTGQIRRIEEIDRYRFSVPEAGPVTIELVARRVGSPLHGMLKVRDPAGNVIVDVADSEGSDFAVTMAAVAGVEYELSLHDLDFAGDRSYVYRLILTRAPQVKAAYPAAGQRGQTREVEFVGPGLATGGDQLESVTRTITFPDSANGTFDYVLETPKGMTTPVHLLVTEIPEAVEPASGESMLTVPGAVTGAIESRFGSDRHTVSLMKGQSWEITAQARSIGSPLDVELTILGPDGKQVATNDDVPGTTDASLTLNVPADGVYQISVADRSGKSGSRAANYRLSIQAPTENVELTVPPLLAVPLGSQTKLVLKCTRKGGFKGAVPVTVAGLPPGITIPENLVIPEGKPELTVDLTCAADAAVTASLCAVSIAPQIGSQTDSRLAGSVLVAITMKPRFKLTPEGLDDVRKVHRGSTFLFPMLIERLEGFEGPITLEMTAKQQRHRQGLASDEFVVPPHAKRIEYPIFVPEWMETTKTSRMILNGSAKVPDPKGNVRTVLQRQEMRFGILPEGALMKLTHRVGEVVAAPGSEIQVPLALSLASELKEPIQIVLVHHEPQAAAITAKAVELAAGQIEAKMVVGIPADLSVGAHELRFRASTKKDGWPVISETTVLVDIRSKP